MIGSLQLSTLQEIWWLLASLVGSIFLFLTFVQGGQTLLWQVAKDDTEKGLVLNSLGRKWELTFTTLVLFGGALFAAFPKFYATSFGGAYWVWVLILFTFVVQAVSYEFRKKPDNLLGARSYEFFLFLNGSVGVLLIGAAVATFFSGSNFELNAYNFVNWTHPLRGLEAAFSVFNLSLGIFLMMHARTLGAMYLVNNIDFKGVPGFEQRLRKQVLVNLLISLPFLFYFLIRLLIASGQEVGVGGMVSYVEHKYLHNLLANPVILILLLLGLVLVLMGVYTTVMTPKKRGIWCGGLGTTLVGLAVFFTAGYNNTPFYPSKVDLQSSLTIYNASSSHYTLTAMTYVAFTIPLVLAYIFYVWRSMDKKKLSTEDLDPKGLNEVY